MATSHDQSASPAYGSFQAFSDTLGILKERGITQRIDFGLMPSDWSDSTKGQLRSGMRFLGLVDEAWQPTDMLRALVEAHSSAAWSEQLASVVDSAYEALFERIDLSSVTGQHLLEVFCETYNVSPQVGRKGVRFFLNAWAEAGRALSPHLKLPGASKTPSGAKRKRSRKKKDDSPESGSEPPPPADGMQTVLVPKTFKVYEFPLRPDVDVKVPLPKPLTTKDVQRLELFLKTLAFDIEVEGGGAGGAS